MTDLIGEWEAKCTDPNSCHRHQRCMYGLHDCPVAGLIPRPVDDDYDDEPQRREGK